MQVSITGSDMVIHVHIHYSQIKPVLFQGNI
jgi:hypothetical protein